MRSNLKTKLTTKLTTSMLLAGAAALAGCEGPSPEQQTAEKLSALLDRMDRLDFAHAPVAQNKLTYTNGAVIEGVTLAGDTSADAVYLDQALVLLPEAREVAQSGTAAQKQAANTIIASILTDEGSYLTNQAERIFQEGTSKIAFLRDRAGLVQSILAHNRALAGDRAVVIDTLETGDIGNGQTVDGVRQLQAQVAAADDTATEAGGELAEALAQIERLREAALEYESLDLKLTNEAEAAQAQARFAKLEEATQAMKEAQLAEAKADALETDAEVLAGRVKLAESRKELSQAVVDELKDKVDQIKAERRTVADKLAQLDQDRKDALAALADAYNRLDAMMQVGAFDRMAKASDRFEQADRALTQANLGSRGDLRRMALYTLHARSLQQQTLAAQTYAAMLGTLTAAGPEVLGSGLHDAITQRIEQMQSLQAAVQQAATELDETASTTLSSVSGEVDEETSAGRTAGKLVELYRSLIDVARG